MNTNANISKTDEKIKDMIENQNNFYELSKEAYPLLNQLKALLQKYGFNNKSTYITIGEDDYIEFNPFETSWALRQLNCDEGPKIVFDFKKEISLEEV